jgi:heptosyltransferase II
MASTPERLLVRGVNWLGDAVMSTPALLRLRAALPMTHIALLTAAKLAPLWERHPAVDQVIPFTEEDSVIGIARRLRAGSFDTALVLPNSPRSALEVFLAGIPHRVGCARPWRNLLLTHIIPARGDEVKMHKRSHGEVERLIRESKATTPPPASAHHLHHYLHLAAALGANRDPLPPLIAVLDSEVDAVRARFATDAMRGKPLIGLNAGAEYGPAKRWPRERFVEAGIALQQRAGCALWIFGGPADVLIARGIAEEIQSAAGAIPGTVRCLAGETSLRELCAALKACDVLLTNDTGPMHVAAAVGTPVVVPFGSTSPELTGPGLPGDARHRLIKSDAPCSPCFLRECPIDFRCMKGLSVSALVEATLSALAGRMKDSM